jgi:IPT/TIG domain/S-layer homology domain
MTSHARRVLSAQFVLMLSLCAASASATTYTVTNTADSGAGSLRQAITDANTNGGTDTIAFNIPGSGVHTINVPTALPTITSPVIIDGTTQPGYAGNPLIELHGAGVPGVYVSAGGSTLRGLVLNGFSTAILLQSAGGNLIEGCYVGTDATGTVDASTGGIGIRMINSDNNTIGGTSASSRNLISGNDSVGVSVEVSDGLIFRGNLVGTDITGTVALQNGTAGLSFSNSDNATVGGSAAGAGNVFSGNLGGGIGISGGNGFLIQGNFIGTDITGTKPLGNGMGINDSGGASVTIGGSGPGEGNLISGNTGIGLYAYNGATDTTIFGNFVGTDVTGTLPIGNLTGIATANDDGGVQIGGTNPGEGNVIAFSSGYLAYSLPVGVLVYSGSHKVPIRGNSIHDNQELGISFNSGGPTPNDPGDADTGSNDQQNFPILKSVVHGASSTEIVGKFNSAASTTYTLDFYANPGCTRFPRDFDEGETYLGSSQITTDATGHKDFDITLPVGTANDARITATATDPLGNTSEFSQRIIFSMNPSSGPAAGGRPLQIFGTDFSDPLTLTIGGAATDYDFVNDHTLYPTSPALPAGTVNDVVVTTSDGTTGTLVKGWVADFLDVPEGHQFHSYVTTLVSNAITVGIGGGLYGVDQPTKRQQMAVFLLKSRHGLCYVPPPCVGVFPDVPCPSTFANWIEALAAEQITGGCGGGNYCPETPVRRDQMAVFLLKSKYGPSYVPPDCTGVYADVPCPGQFANWIEELGTEQITGGCGGGNYCPASSNTRGQMAVFLVKTFHLPN